MNTLLAGLQSGLTDPPHSVDPISAWSIAGHSVMLVMGLITLAGSAATPRHERLGRWSLMISGCGETWYAQTRFLRAIHPENACGFRWTVLLFLGLIALSTWAVARLLHSMRIGITVLAGGAVALILAIVADHFFEELAAIPIALVTLVAAGVALVLVLRARL